MLFFFCVFFGGGGGVGVGFWGWGGGGGGGGGGRRCGGGRRGPGRPGVRTAGKTGPMTMGSNSGKVACKCTAWNTGVHTVQILSSSGILPYKNIVQRTKLASLKGGSGVQLVHSTKQLD